MKSEKQANRGHRKSLVGVVTSDKMEKTIVIKIEQRKLHPLYKKYITVSKKLKAHDAENLCRVGDRVKVVQTRPLSREKRWRLLEIIEKAK